MSESQEKNKKLPRHISIVKKTAEQLVLIVLFFSPFFWHYNSNFLEYFYRLEEKGTCRQQELNCHKRSKTIQYFIKLFVGTLL